MPSAFPDQTVDPDVRSRIIKAAAQLLASGGRDALTTRAVVAAVGIQQPTLYRLFGDKTGLLDAVAEAVLASYVADKTEVMPHVDPLTDFCMGWDRHVAFGLAHPALFAIIWGDPHPAKASPAAAAGQAALKLKIRALAVAGLLRVNETIAAHLAHASCTGVILTLLGMPEHARDAELATTAREAVVAAITRTEPVSASPGPAGAAIALRASVVQSKVLTPGERLLLDELLDRLATDHVA